MKKLMLLMAVVVAIGFTSCSDDDDGGAINCPEAVQSAADAASAYAGDDSLANCQFYKASLQALITGECVTGVQATTTQALIDSLICDE